MLSETIFLLCSEGCFLIFFGGGVWVAFPLGPRGRDLAVQFQIRTYQSQISSVCLWATALALEVLNHWQDSSGAESAGAASENSPNQGSARLWVWRWWSGHSLFPLPSSVLAPSSPASEALAGGLGRAVGGFLGFPNIGLQELGEGGDMFLR